MTYPIPGRITVFTTTNALKRRVLSITGAKTLNEARQIFMSNVDKRIDVILSNADSVSYLVTHLGRMLDEGPEQAPNT